MPDHTCKRAGMFLEHYGEGTRSTYFLVFLKRPAFSERRFFLMPLLVFVKKEKQSLIKTCLLKWETANRERKEWKWEQTYNYTLLMYFYYPFIFLFPFFISRCPFPVPFSPFPVPRFSNIYRRPVMKPAWQWIEKWE